MNDQMYDYFENSVVPGFFMAFICALVIRGGFPAFNQDAIGALMGSMFAIVLIPGFILLVSKKNKKKFRFNLWSILISILFIVGMLANRS